MEAKEKLILDIETSLHCKMKTPRDFDFLRLSIYARLHEIISATTLKRFWGYLTGYNSVSSHTLDVLVRFLGYEGWDDYCANLLLPEKQQSNPVMSRHINVNRNLKAGDKVRLTWQPERICDVEYLGKLKFKVLYSENTRIKEGDTFECNLIIEGEPLYIDRLIQKGHQPTPYVCGKKKGVMFEFIK